ncbi:hypothetical protein FVE85_0009 [Porphyridium purpureum]|uniref:CCHC-type domain-containing protein n=1 Tax=Porphyridium purpureum TaxID=35688 RepID=A0A5J4YZ70_PORPP|nr:hypothetical protein FVE85_0009 [Porphyridium purpureum]|eukprot:POR2870..scf208_2
MGQWERGITWVLRSCEAGGGGQVASWVARDRDVARDLAKLQLTAALKWNSDIKLARSKLYAVMRGPLSVSSVEAMSARAQWEQLEIGRDDPLGLKNLSVVVHLTPPGATADRCRAFARERFQLVRMGNNEALGAFKGRLEAAMMGMTLVDEPELTASRQAEEFLHRLEKSRFAQAVRQAFNNQRMFGNVREIMIYLSTYKYAAASAIALSTQVLRAGTDEYEATRLAEGRGTMPSAVRRTANGDPIQCRYCDGLGHIARICKVKARDAQINELVGKLEECRREIKGLKEGMDAKK